ncbi:odorant receptor 4-like [Anoplolepis gracilipes]|uniref:odorant receptor 4-like n=1 Tax=Anoplolepis gracilipes TaxID=354296 RepID=UPI003B9F17B8
MKVENIISRILKICLQIFGIWPDSSCVLLSRIFWIISLIIEQIFQYQYIIIHFYSTELFEVMSMLSEAMSYSTVLMKLLIFWYKQRTFNSILMMMANDWEKYSNSEFNMFTMTCHVVVKHTDDKASNISTRPLVINMNLPFDFNRTYVYELTIIIQFIHVMLCTLLLGTLNSLLISLILHLGGQIDILCGWLTEIFPMNKKSNSNFFMVKKIIKKHQQIIAFSEHIEDLFSNIALVLFVSDTLIICCLGFVIIMSVGTPDAVKIIIRTLLFYFAMNMEAFVFCFAGEYLNSKSNSIGNAAYNSFWYESNSKNSRIILLLQMRSQKQLAITIGKIMNLSLERFSSIIKASASYISVLLAMS